MNYTVTQVCPSWTTNSYPDLVDQVYKPLSNIQDLLPNYSSLYLRVRQDQIFVVNQGKEMLLKDSSHSDSNRIQTSANQILQLAGYHSRPSYYPHSPIYCQKVEQFNPKDLSSEIATLKQKIALLQQKLYEPNSAELNALREENSILQSQLKEAQKSLQGLRSELEQVKTSTTKDLTALQSEYQASVATLSKTFEKNLIANEKRIEELNRQITEKEQANARAQSSIETLESDKEELRHQLELAKTENSTLVQEHVENLALAKSEYLKALRQLELKQGQTLDEFMATLIAPLNQKLEAANKRIQDLEIQITESKRTSAENTQLKESLAKVEEEKADLQRRIAELPDKATDVVKANQEVIAIQAKLAAAQQKISKQEELLELAKTDYDQRLNELEKQATAQINEFKETNIAHYEERISALQTELKKAEAAKAEALEQIHSQRTSELEAEIKKQAAVLTKLKNDIAIYEEEHKQKAAVKKEVIDRFSEYRFDYLTDKGKALLDRQALEKKELHEILAIIDDALHAEYEYREKMHEYNLEEAATKAALQSQQELDRLGKENEELKERLTVLNELKADKETPLSLKEEKGRLEAKLKQLENIHAINFELRRNLQSLESKLHEAGNDFLTQFDEAVKERKKNDELSESRSNLVRLGKELSQQHEQEKTELIASNESLQNSNSDLSKKVKDLEKRIIYQTEQISDLTTLLSDNDLEFRRYLIEAERSRCQLLEKSEETRNQLISEKSKAEQKKSAYVNALAYWIELHQKQYLIPELGESDLSTYVSEHPEVLDRILTEAKNLNLELRKLKEELSQVQKENNLLELKSTVQLIKESVSTHGKEGFIELIRKNDSGLTYYKELIEELGQFGDKTSTEIAYLENLFSDLVKESDSSETDFTTDEDPI